MRRPLVEEISTPLSAAEVFGCFHQEPFAFFLDSGMDPAKLGRYSFIGWDPFLVLNVNTWVINPLSPILGGEKETQRGFAPLHAPMGGTGEAKLAREAHTPQTPGRTSLHTLNICDGESKVVTRRRLRTRRGKVPRTIVVEIASRLPYYRVELQSICGMHEPEGERVL